MFGWLGILIGILLILVGGYLIIFFPSMPEHQPTSMTLGAIILGFVLAVAGALLIIF